MRLTSLESKNFITLKKTKSGTVGPRPSALKTALLLAFMFIIALGISPKCLGCTSAHGICPPHDLGIGSWLEVKQGSQEIILTEDFEVNELGPEWKKVEGWICYAGKCYPGEGGEVKISRLDRFGRVLTIIAHSYWYGVYAKLEFEKRGIPVPIRLSEVSELMLEYTAIIDDYEDYDSTGFGCGIGSGKLPGEDGVFPYSRSSLGISYSGYDDAVHVGFGRTSQSNYYDRRSEGWRQKIPFKQIERGRPYRFKLKLVFDHEEQEAELLVSVYDVDAKREVLSRGFTIAGDDYELLRGISIDSLCLSTGVGVHWEGGTRVHFDDLTLIIRPVRVELFNFSLAISPKERWASPWESTTVTYTVNVELLSGPSEVVTLQVSGLPRGARASFSPPSGTPPFTSTLSITTAEETPPGFYELTIAARGGGVSRSIKAKLVVAGVRVLFSSSMVNGKRLSSDNPEIVVRPGERLSGYLEVIVENMRLGHWLTPVIGTCSWGREITGQAKGWFVTITDDAPTGSSKQRFEFDLRAPSTPGTYYIGVFTGWMYTGDEVASGDHPPKFGNGNDVWDLRANDWESVIGGGRAPKGSAYRMPGRAIRVVVEERGLPMPGLVVRDLPDVVSGGEAFEVALTYTAKIPAVGVIITEYLPPGIEYVEAEPEPAVVEKVPPPAQILKGLDLTAPHVTMLKWLLYSKEPLRGTAIKYKAKYNPELLPKAPRALPFHGEYEAVDVEGREYNGTVAGDLVLKVDIGLPGPWDDDGKVTDSEILDAIASWARGEIPDIAILKLIQLWAKTAMGVSR